MYSQELLTPHQFKAEPAEQRVPLADAARLDSIAIELAHLKQQDVESYEDAKVEAATAIAHQVSRSLWFPMSRYGRNESGDRTIDQLAATLTADTIPGLQAANCFGYSIVTSECLDTVGIDHWIGYANGHAFLLLPHQNNDVFLLDSLSPRFNQFLGKGLDRGNPEQIEAQIQEHDRAAVMIDATVVARNTGVWVDELAHMYPWLTVARTMGSDHRMFGNDEARSAERYYSRYKLVTSVFNAEKGRSMLAEFMHFQAAMNMGKIRAASNSLRRMNGFYPELDARQSLRAIQEIVTTICVTNPEEATELANDFFDSNFRLSQDSRIPVAKGDVFRKIAKRAGSVAAAGKAVEAYRTAAEHPKAFRSAVLGKLATAVALHEELGGQHA